MQINQLKIEGILGIKLGTPFHNKTVKQTFRTVFNPHGTGKSNKSNALFGGWGQRKK